MTKQKTYAMEELYPVWTKLAGKYTGADSTSLPWEKAQMLMGAVLYCLQESGMYPGAIVSAGGSVSLQERYETGRRLVREKAEGLRDLYHELLVVFQDYGVLCLREVVTEGLPAFFLQYDMEFEPQHTILTLDYPLLYGLPDGSGVDAVWEYTKGIFMEQQFLKGFDTGYILAVLGAYSSEYELLAENICGIVIPCLAGHLLLKKPLQEKLSPKDRRHLATLLRGYAPADLSAILEKMLDGLCRERYPDPEEPGAYLKSCISDISVRIRGCVENDCMERVFLV